MSTYAMYSKACKIKWHTMYHIAEKVNFITNQQLMSNYNHVMAVITNNHNL